MRLLNILPVVGVCDNPISTEQMTIGEVDISRIRFDLKSRDDIPKILTGLQFIYTHAALRTSIFQLLESQIAPKVSKTNGRPGMTLWTILVCGVIRLDLNCDYDRLHELVNQHNTLREMLGHGAFDDVSYHVQTLKVRIPVNVAADSGNVTGIPANVTEGRCCAF